MKSFDVQGIDLNVSASQAFAFIADPTKLPKWTNAFTSVTPERTVMETPNGRVEIDLGVEASPEQGTVDWRMTFPDQSVASAYSRVVEVAPERCIFSFVLMAPPVPLEQLEGALDAQSQILEEELEKLKEILEAHG